MSEKKKPFSAFEFRYHFPLEIDGKTVLVTYEGEYPGFYYKGLQSFWLLELEDTNPSDLTYGIADHTRSGHPAYFIPVEELRKDVLDDTLLKLAEKLGAEKVYVEEKRKTGIELMAERIKKEIVERKPETIQRMTEDICNLFKKKGIKITPEVKEFVKKTNTSIYERLVEVELG